MVVGKELHILFSDDLANPVGLTGEAGSGEPEIRRWILEKDYLVAITGTVKDEDTGGDSG